MERERFSKLRHDAVHELMRLNESCEEQYQISSWPHWDYELKRETLTFSKDGVPKVIASIQVIGTTSVSGGTWMWGWANESLPVNVTKEVSKVRMFGVTENITELTQAELPDDEYIGWEMTSVAAKLLGAKGAYRCPGKNGFVYLIYSSIKFVEATPENASSANQVECADHGSGLATYVCEHLVSKPAQLWFSGEIDVEHRWPDSWCVVCDGFFQEQGEWNEKNESKIKIKVLCHHCYERLRSQSTLPTTEN